MGTSSDHYNIMCEMLEGSTMARGKGKKPSAKPTKRSQPTDEGPTTSGKRSKRIRGMLSQGDGAAQAVAAWAVARPAVVVEPHITNGELVSVGAAGPFVFNAAHTG
jgi:hypothetical protein